MFNLNKSNRKNGIKKKALFGMSAPATTGTLLALLVLGYFAGNYVYGILKGISNDTVVSEYSQFASDVTTFKVKATAKGAGYVNKKDSVAMNADNLDVYTKTRPTLVGTGASSYFCSNSTFGCKIKYYFSTGANDETWSLFTDASLAFATMDAKEITALETEIEKVFSDGGYNPIVDHSATAVSAASTSVTASSTNDGDGVFEIGNL